MVKRKKGSVVIVLFLLMTGVALLGVATSADAAAKCGQVKIVSGETCRALALDFDLTDCDDLSPKGKVKISCQGESGIASVKTKKFTYQVRIQRYKGSLGNVVWDTVGDVNQTPIQVPVLTKAAELVRPVTPPVAIPPESPASSAAAAVTPPSVVNVAPSGIVFSGLFDAYYANNFNHPQSFPLPSSKTPYLPASQSQLRNFDVFHDQFALNLVELSFKKTGEEVSFRADLDFGEMADFTSRQPDGVAVDDVSKHIGQAILTYTPKSLPNMTIGLGKMATHMGYETTKARDNWQYSRSFLYSLAIPYWHTGVSAAYAWLPGKFVTSGYIYNGWNSIYDNNQAKTLGLQFAYTPNDDLAANYNLITGPEQPGDNADRKTVHEVNVSWKVSPRWSFASDFVYGQTQHDVLPTGIGNATWTAGTTAVKFSPLSWYYFSPRFEIYRDEGGFTTGATQTLTSATATNSIMLADGLETRLEFRLDHSTGTPFLKANGGIAADQATLTAGFLYVF